MKIVVIGTRGIPGILGGVETHCEELYPRIAAAGHDVTLIRRTPYIADNNHITEYKGVHLVDVYAPRRKSIEAIVHTFLAVLKAKNMHPDILHVHAIGPALMVPFARLLGMRVVMTNHGPDYDRQKWGKLAKAVLRTGERAGTKYANRVIVISKTIASILANKYERTDTDLIFNGVNAPVKTISKDWLQKWGIDKPYILSIGRFVKEKGFHHLIEAFKKAGLQDRFQLVIAGDSDHEDNYSRELKEQAKREGMILTGFIKGEPLAQVMTNASLFVIPSSHEGLPIALLEAMSYNLDVLASDIPANCIPQLDRDKDFFKTEDVDSLAEALVRKVENGLKRRTYDLEPYNWDKIAAQTIEVYKSVL